jgi:hypothetical protein
MGIAYVREKMAGLSSSVRTWHRLLRGAVFFLLIAIGITGCSSAPETDSNAPPPFVDVFHYDAAFRLVARQSLPDRLDVYIAIGGSLAEEGRVERAVIVLSYAEALLESGDFAEDVRFDLWSRAVAAWQSVAARDETRAATVDEKAIEMLNAAGRVDDPTLQARVFRVFFTALLDNPNADEGVIRRALDLAYLIDTDEVRAEVLVDAADQVEGRDDRVSLNPLAQQAIATIPALDDPLLAVDLGARLAVLSVVLGRPGDAVSLVDRVVQRSEAGLVVDPTEQARLRRLVTSLVSADGYEAIPRILANVVPQRMRVLGYGWYAESLWEADRDDEALAVFEEAYRLAVSVGDVGMRAETRALLIRLRARQEPAWDAPAAAASLLADVRLASLAGSRRESIISSIAVAYALSGRPELTDRLRGLIVSGDEFARINIRIAEQLTEYGRRGDAVSFLREVSAMPAPGLEDAITPEQRAAEVWYRLGEYDRAITVALGRDDLEVARLLARTPASHQINPATRGELARRVDSVS